MAQQKQFDVVIVGGSVGGCTAATLFARQGLNVALLECTDDDAQFKKVCTHCIQPAAMKTLVKLGLAARIEAAGGLRNELEVWTEFGWIRAASPEKVGHGFNVRRQTLDPILREMATGTTGVNYFPATSADSLLRDAAGRVAGVSTSKYNFMAPLVVAADGRNSRMAKQAEVPAKIDENGRFTYFTYYRNLPLRSRANSQYWHMDDNLAYAFRNDDDTTLLGIFLPHKEQKAFQRDALGNFRKFWDSVPDAPCMGDAQPICELRGITKIPNHRRPASAPGIAFVGDAATVMDPIWGTGCSFAFLAADWLVERTASVFAEKNVTAAIDRGLRDYRKFHRAQLKGHYWHISSFSKVRPLNFGERLLFSAATRDPQVAECVLTYFSRTVGLSHLASRTGLFRSMLVNLGLIPTAYRSNNMSLAVRSHATSTLT